ncbi:hypothetical protein M408DRAFT_265866 [Serendipita vermifera MAFF 305830]|uniref:Uncharacterized protein n=1 Tax=Serendipita vermifera MAFF 305830 TaxID=933852 RepID=A0A0C3AEY2_SERVB|nr:hypothetical protein M408DRAFT_265866 [Serendipita vermifera MAFF 305830]
MVCVLRLYTLGGLPYMPVSPTALGSLMAHCSRNISSMRKEKTRNRSECYSRALTTVSDGEYGYRRAR